MVSRGSVGGWTAHRPARHSSRRGWLSFTRTSSALPVAAVAAKVFLTVERVGGEQDAAQAQPLDQRLGRRDLVALGDLLVGQDERVLAGERAEHLRRGPVVQVVEAAPQRLAVQRDDPPPRRGGGVPELLGIGAEGGLVYGRVERVEEGAKGVDGGRATEAGTEDGVEPLAMHADEQADAAVGGRPGEDGQHPRRAAGERGCSAGPGGGAGRGSIPGRRAARRTAPCGLRCEGFALNSPGALPIPRPHDLPSRTSPAQNRTALPDHPKLLIQIGNLAELYWKSGRYAEAELLL